MKTKIRLAGGKFGIPESGQEDKKTDVLWEGDMPFVDAIGMRIVDESNEDSVKVYAVSQVAFHYNKSATWQTVFVMPVRQAAG